MRHQRKPAIVSKLSEYVLTTRDLSNRELACHAGTLADEVRSLEENIKMLIIERDHLKHELAAARMDRV